MAGIGIRTRYFKEITQIAQKFALDPMLVEAIVVVESAGNSDAFRFEPDYWNRYLKGKPEWSGKNPRRVSSSYGLMQVLYPFALEDGFDAAAPPEMLFIPEIGLTAGCTRLGKLLAWAEDGWPTLPRKSLLEAAIASYKDGTGGNRPTDQPNRCAAYAKKVLAVYETLKKEHVS